MKRSDAKTRVHQTNDRQIFHTILSDDVGLLCLKEAKVGGTSLLVGASKAFSKMDAQRPDLLQLVMLRIATDHRDKVSEGMLLIC